MFFKNRINLSTQKYITAVDSLSMVTLFLCQFKYIGLLDITYKIPIFKIQSTVASTFWKFKTNENIFVGLAGAAVGAAAGAGAAKVLPGKHDTKVRGHFLIPALNTSFRKPQLLALQSDSPLVDIITTAKRKRKNRKKKIDK